MTRVFVSSVSRGLETTRQQLVADLQRANYDIGAMERFGAQPEPPIDVCLREVRRAEVVVLVIGPRYGSILPQGISYTEAEFREAQGHGIPVLAFRIPNEASLGAEEVRHLTDFATAVGATTTYDTLASDDSLSARVLAALSSARDRGDLGHRFSLFQRFDRYFAAELGGAGALFNHEGPFLGRAAELKRLVDFLLGNEPLLLLTAAGEGRAAKASCLRALEAWPKQPALLTCTSRTLRHLGLLKTSTAFQPSASFSCSTTRTDDPISTD